MKRAEDSTGGGLMLVTVGAVGGNQEPLVQSIAKAIGLVGPRACWLLPSSAEESIAVAELVKGQVMAQGPVEFPEVAGAEFVTLDAPYSVEGCRQCIAALIKAVRAQYLRAGERLYLNPTSGTKQMTAAAVLAALDAGIGEIQFIEGRGSRGVVTEGAERIEKFEAGTYFEERDRIVARQLAQGGAFAAGAELLKGYGSPASRQLRQRLLALHHWRRLHYRQAIAALGDGHRRLQQQLAQRADAGAAPSKTVIADILAWAELEQQWQEPEAVVWLCYRAVEFGSYLAFAEQTGLAWPPTLEALNDLQIPARLRERAWENAPCGVVLMGLRQRCGLLDALGHRFAAEYFGNRALQDGLNLRNAATHDIQPVSLQDAKTMLQATATLLKAVWPDMPKSKIDIGAVIDA